MILSLKELVRTWRNRKPTVRKIFSRNFNIATLQTKYNNNSKNVLINDISFHTPDLNNNELL